MTKTTKESRRVHRQEALEAYLALGPQRSLTKLHRKLTELSPNPQSVDMLKYWSARYGWQRAVAEHDASVAAKVAGKLERAEAKERFDQIEEFSSIIQEGAAALKDWISDPANLKKIGNATEFSSMSNALARLTQVVQLLSGRPTSRFDSTHRAEPPEWMREQLRESVRDSDSETDVSVH